MRLPELGYVTKIKGIQTSLGALEDLFKIIREKQEKGKKAKESKIVKKVRKAMLTLLLSIDKQPIPPEYTILYSIEAVNKILGDKAVIFPLSNKRIRKLAKEADVKEGDLLIAMRLLRGAGLLEIFYLGNRRIVALTQLGAILRDYIGKEGISDTEKALALVLASFPFSTKMRVIYGLYYEFGESYHNFYTAIKVKMPEEYRGLERLAFEILNELALSLAGGAKGYISETHMLVKLLNGAVTLFGNDREAFNEVFRSINHYVRFPYGDRFTYELAARKALEPRPYYKLEEVLEKHGLASLLLLFNKLKENFVEIERQFNGLYGLPIKIYA